MRGPYPRFRLLVSSDGAGGNAAGGYGTRRVMYGAGSVYPHMMGKHLIDFDEDALSAARAELGTATIEDTVNEALRRATPERERFITASLNVLATANLDDRVDAWR